MRSFKGGSCPALLFILAVSILAAPSNRQHPRCGLIRSSLSSYQSVKPEHSGHVISKRAAGGIREIVPREFQDRYEKWKNGVLVTPFGRQMWDRYASNREFTLTINVTHERKSGAVTDGYKWSNDGTLVGATITLGKNLDKGYPEPIYYPVMNSLAIYNYPDVTSGNILASTKIVHEFGHVDFAVETDSNVFRRQNKLIADYNRIFLTNGYNTKDPRLLEIAGQLGGMPVDIWADREYWSEAVAMRYLLERIRREPFYCSVVSRMSRNINNYARNYREMFEQISHHLLLPAACRH